jgi:hypothetical protein
MKKQTLLISMLLLTALLFGNAIAESQTIADPTNKEYLEYYYSIKLPESSVDKVTFGSALSQITGKQVHLNSNSEVFKAIIAATDLTELAHTYTTEKALSRLQHHGITAEIPSNMLAYVACALDAHLIEATVANRVLKTDKLDSYIAIDLLMSIANANGLARNYIGKVSDKDILMRISNAFNSFTLFSDGYLDEIGAIAVQQRASTGYNLKKNTNSAQFLPSRTIQYGHSNYSHLKQLTILLNSEGIDAKLQIEPKVSIYEYLLDWGPVPSPSPYYMVLEFGQDFYLAYAVEYDAKFEFDSVDDLMRFDQIINTFAKKNDANQAKDSTVSLLKGSWWQPLYSTTFLADNEAYQEIVDCVLESDGYSIHPFSLLENKQNLIDTLENLSGLTVLPRPLFVNNAFYRYLTGSDYQ